MVGVLASSRLVDEVYSKPPAFTMIRKNVYLTQVKPKKAEGALCSCSKQCGPNCLNRALRIACIGHGMHVDEATGLSTHSGRVTAYDTCNVGAGCGNRSIQQRKCPALQPFKTHQRGWGLRAAEDVKAGQFVIEYVGEVRRGGGWAGACVALHTAGDACASCVLRGWQVVDEATQNKRLEEAAGKGIVDMYFMEINNNLKIDAREKGNLSRFINHSCDPNCELQKW